MAAVVQIALAQLNATVGDIDSNLYKARAAIQEAKKIGADLIALPELFLTGYPPEDLLLKRSFVDANMQAVGKLAAETGITVICGFVERFQERLYNAAAVARDGQLQVYRKQHLPNYGVFDEKRHFTPGTEPLVFEVSGVKVGVTICEDLWVDNGPHEQCAALGASVIVNINGSPYHVGRGDERLKLLQKRTEETRSAFAYVNMVGGQDELVFDGQSMFVDAGGNLIGRAAQFEEQLLIVDLAADGAQSTIAQPLQSEEEIYKALVTGTSDYLAKNGFQSAVVGISGGVDSALTACIAADAIGPQAVTGVFNPSEYTSSMSTADSAQLAANLKIKLVVLPIDDAFDAMKKTLDPVFAGAQEGVAEENLQSRIRGNLWMAMTNRFGGIVLSTGNKSEMSVGYATLYGDMAGGFAVLKDVPKTLVYKLARYRDSVSPVIPERILTRPPTAELRQNQKDTDNLPPYEVLDPILDQYILHDRSVAEIVKLGFDSETVHRVVAMVDAAEYKRRQTPPGVKITPKAFGRDRRLPITNRWTERVDPNRS